MDIASLGPTPRTVETAGLGPVTLHPVDEFGDELAEIAKAADADSFIDALLLAGASMTDSEPVAEHDLRRLTPDDRVKLVKALIEMNVHWTAPFGDTGDADTETSRIMRGRVPRERLEAEGDVEYLWRSFTSYREEADRSMAQLAEQIRNDLKGLGASMQQALRPVISANAIIGRTLQESINRALGPTSDLARLARDPFADLPREFKGGGVRPHSDIFPEPPSSPRGQMAEPAVALNTFESPVARAVEVLNQVRGDIQEMKTLAAESAGLQLTLNEAARNILVQFVTGAEASERATTQSLKLAKDSRTFALWGVGVGALALVVSAIFSGVQLRMAADTAAADARDRAADRTVEERLAKALERANQAPLAAQPAPIKPATKTTSKAGR